MIGKLICAFGFALTVFVGAASAQTADDVVNKMIEARGGVAKMQAITSVKMSGTATLGGGFQAPVTIMFKRPGSFRLELTAQGMTLVQATDGTTAWMINPFEGMSAPKVLTGAEAAEVQDGADMDGPLVGYKEKGNTIELVGKEPVAGSDAYKVKVSLKSGSVNYVFIDATSFLEVKATGKHVQQGVESEVESFPTNYKPVEGVLFPFDLENKMGGTSQFQMTIDSIEVNKPMDDAVFKLPK